ncbi:hypothetical protein CYMTET_33251 [Cymbomonas tetramitiformis]|uniref:Chitin-binding type-4 domain-containing protein n=1 Tax=Cymbomonas tetramitiformis TaxID=36881 RepID=A0AAE0KRD7_9CHLO|nr:hypothetical protein CYMTET_33251 [Cymbomonas tetramitiformis]
MHLGLTNSFSSDNNTKQACGYPFSSSLLTCLSPVATPRCNGPPLGSTQRVPQGSVQVPGGYPGGGSPDVTPWRAPGSAPVFSPCGIAGGNPLGCPVGAKQPVGTPCPGGGDAYGSDALNTSFPEAITTEWIAGSVVEAGWGIQANHGGGYSYRLCKRSEGLTEECFQRTPLDFVGDTQFVQWGPDSSKRVEFKANRTRDGTVPAGSQWTKNPIPACAIWGGGMSEEAGNACGPEGPQFPSPTADLVTGEPLEGFCEVASTNWRSDCNFTIVDKLKVPSSMAEGDYALSFRWDCEQTTQIWTTCANIRIKAAELDQPVQIA